MRKIPKEFQKRLDSGATTFCRCWKIERSDGRTFGFTDHDCSLFLDGLTYEASSGLDTNALQTSTGLSVDNSQAMGALSSSAITEGDIRGGRFDRAKIFHWLVDWQHPELRVLLFSGTLGEVRRSDAAFEVELRGLTEDLNVPAGRSILRCCDRVLGDRKCGFNLNAEGYSATADLVSDVRGAGIICSGLSDFDADWFLHGKITWLSGQNAGLTNAIRADRINGDGTRTLNLWKEPAFPIAVGDRFQVFAGCDKQAKTCLVKFANFLNFRGFPHLPGEDWVTAYPREGDLHDGSSLA